MYNSDTFIHYIIQVTIIHSWSKQPNELSVRIIISTIGINIAAEEIISEILAVHVIFNCDSSILVQKNSIPDLLAFLQQTYVILYFLICVDAGERWPYAGVPLRPGERRNLPALKTICDVIHRPLKNIRLAKHKSSIGVVYKSNIQSTPL